jgi:hypothetical protein
MMMRPALATTKGMGMGMGMGIRRLRGRRIARRRGARSW